MSEPGSVDTENKQSTKPDPVERDRKRRGWKPGESGNPSGRPPGSRNKVTWLAQQLIDQQVEGLVSKAVELAMNGDTTCIKLLLERLIAPQKSTPIRITLPEVSGMQDLPKVTGAILGATAQGDLAPHEAVALAGITEIHRKMVELADLEARLKTLEERIPK